MFVAQDTFPDHFNAFDYTQAFGGHHHHPSAFSANPPSPPNASFGQLPAAVQQHQDHQQQQQQQHNAGHQGQSPSSNGSVNGGSSSRGDGAGSVTKVEANLEEAGRGGSEEDDIMTPAQSRRKAQNRAA